jgi:hypothetical protein
MRQKLCIAVSTHFFPACLKDKACYILKRVEGGLCAHFRYQYTKYFFAVIFLLVSTGLSLSRCSFRT